jgi:hypothetical protein
MLNVEVMLTIYPIYWSSWQQLKDKLETSTEERKHVNTEEINKKKNRYEEK